MNKLNALKVLSLALAGIGMIVANELQKREIKEGIEEALAERSERDTQDNVVEMAR